jgi:hypothetical protein
MDTTELRHSLKKLNKSINVYKERVEILEKKVVNRDNYLHEDLEIWLSDKMKLFELEEDVMGLMELYKTMKNLE